MIEEETVYLEKDSEEEKKSKLVLLSDKQVDTHARQTYTQIFIQRERDNQRRACLKQKKKKKNEIAVLREKEMREKRVERLWFSLVKRWRAVCTYTSSLLENSLSLSFNIRLVILRQPQRSPFSTKEEEKKRREKKKERGKNMRTEKRERHADMQIDIDRQANTQID